MSIEIELQTLLSRQETILGIFNTNATTWDEKLDKIGGTITGDIIFQNIGKIDFVNKIINFDLVSLDIKSQVTDVKTELNLLANNAGKSVLNLGMNNDVLHASEINLGTSRESFLKIERTSGGLSNIIHNGIADLIISAVGGGSVTFIIQTDESLKIASNGNTEIYHDLTLSRNLLMSGNGIIGKADSNTSLIISGGHTIANNNAYLVLHSGDIDEINPGGFDFHANAESAKPTLSISKDHISSFADNVIIPTLTIKGGIIADAQIPQIVLWDTTGLLNNRKWQIKNESSSLIIQPLTDANAVGPDSVIFTRSDGSARLQSVSFGSNYQVKIDIINSRIDINDQNVLSSRQPGWTNISPIPGVTSRDLSSMSSEATNTAKILRALITDLITHGLIGA